MALRPGTRLGSYEILDPIGAGGMGEVYRASDLELRRTVAIKVLPTSITHSPERLARFRREAQLLAALNHPHIAQIYGIVESDGVRGLVLELVEGETLAGLLGSESSRRSRAGLPVATALGIARQLAAALDAAHAQGIVHRDLKPANIKVTPAGAVKVLDFGLAKVTSPENEAVHAEASTAIGFDTQDGSILGTPGYMSPEQARGLQIDRRTDVWAFGCVLFELLAGRPAFPGTTMADTLAAVVAREPDWQQLPATTPPEIRRLLQRCLQKDVNQRLRDIGDISLSIGDASGGPASEARPASDATRARTSWKMPVIIAIVVVAAGALALYLWSRSSASSETVRMSIASPGLVTPQLSAALSPDGRSVAFVSTDADGKAMLWLRALNQLQAHVLPGTDRAAHPFWSPNGRSLGFIADAKLKRIDLVSGSVQIIADAPIRYGATWGPDDTILFTPRPDQIAAVHATGGPVNPVLVADRSKGQNVLVWPSFLPDGRHFLFIAGSAQADRRGIYVGSLGSKDAKLVLNTDLQAIYSSGYLLFPRDETLMAQRFDLSKLELTGEPLAVAEGIWIARVALHASFSASDAGSLAYVNASMWDSELDWVDRRGQPLGSLGPPVRYYGLTPQISPDGKRVAIGRGELGQQDIWILSGTSGAASRLTFGSNAGLPVWSADGRRVMVKTGAKVIAKDVETGAEETMSESVDGAMVDWSRDGRLVVLARLVPNLDLWIAPLAGDRSPKPYLVTPYNEAQAQLSPDGQWIAYTANETGRDEIYVQSFPEAGRKHQVSPSGGAMPRWRGDGHELFYVAANQYMMAVPVAGGATSPGLGTPQPLFRTRLIVAGSESTGLPTMYDVTRNGERFLLRYRPPDPEPPITVVLNWMAALKR